MKKIVGTIAAVAVAAGVAFAYVGIGSWGRVIFSPVGTLDGGKTFVSNETTFLSEGIYATFGRQYRQLLACGLYSNLSALLLSKLNDE